MKSEKIQEKRSQIIKKKFKILKIQFLQKLILISSNGFIDDRALIN